MSSRFAKLPGSRHLTGVFAAILLATAALAGLSIQSVYREARVRKQFLSDTHRSIGELVSARLETAMTDADRSVAAAIQGIEPRAENLLRKIDEIESTERWLGPMVLMSTSPSHADPGTGPSLHFLELTAAAERAEFQDNAAIEASRLFAKAFAEANTSLERATALNGEARSELKAGEAVRAAATYTKLSEQPDTVDRELVRLAVIAKEKLVECYRSLRNKEEAAKAEQQFYSFLLGRRFLLDADTYDFYRKKIDFLPSQHEQQLDVIAGQFDSTGMRETRIPNTNAMVVHVWTASNVRALLDQLLAEPGPWSEVSVQLIDASGRWRVVASPKNGSVQAVASREVFRFAVLLGLVFATVVVAMFLAALSVSRELAFSRMRSDFVASVSHELKTPLSLIRMFAESLSEGWVSEQKRPEYYEVITRESERLTGLINNVLDFSRIEAGTRKYERTTTELGIIMRALLERYRYHLKAANIDLIEELPSESIEAFVDAEAMEQVLVNLLSNAVKYMGDSERRPRAVTVSLRGSATHALIRIQDTGVGISEEDRLHIFERFWRADNSQVRAVAGSGLGLTLVKHIVEAHNGSIAVDSVPGKGSTFAVTLPLGAGGQP